MRIEGLARTFDASDGQGAGIEYPELYQHGRLVPIDVLMSQLALSKTHDGDQRHLHPLSGRRNALQHPVHADGMGERKHHFVHQLIVANGPRDGSYFRVWRHLGNETLGVKLPQLVPTNTSSQHGNVVYISVLD